MASSNVWHIHSDLDHIEDGIALTGNCLDRNIEKMFNILETLVHETNFDDVNKLRTLIAMVSISIFGVIY